MMKTIFAAIRGVPLGCLALFLTAASGLGADSLISANATWKFLDTDTDPGTAWRGPGFDDSSWASGAAQLGFGDGDEATVIRSGIVTAYFRKKFNVANPADFSSLTLRVLRDDGVAVYLNGVEVFRNNLPAGPLSFNTLALAAVGGAEETTAFLTSTLNANLLVAGENVIAAEVHQVNLTSSDLSFALELLTDAAPPLPDLPVVAVQTVDSAAAEGASDHGRFRVVRSASTSAQLNVELSVTVSYSGTAVNGVDYAALPTTVVIPAGSQTADLEIVPIDDSLVEGAETLTLSLQEPPCAILNPSEPGCYFVGAPSQASANILDNDVAPPPPPPPPGKLILIASNSVWSYLDNGSDQGTAWRAPGQALVNILDNDSEPPPDPCAPIPTLDDQTNPAVASDGTNFLVVWIDMRHRDSKWSDVYGARVSATGKVLDPGGIPICKLASSAYYPAVAFDGANYMVVWSDDRDQSEGNPRLEIYGARVSPGGVVLDPNGIQIMHGEVAFQPTLAFNGTEYLVGAYTWEHNGFRGPTLLGVRVTPAGEVRDLEELILHQSTFGGGGGYPAIVASAGGEWLVAWNGEGVEGARVSASGVVSSPQQLVVEGEAWVNGLAAVGGNYFLTTAASLQLASDTYVMDVFGTWITHEGQPLNTVIIATNSNTTIGSFLQPTTYVQNRATAVANGQEVLVVWEAGAIYTNGGSFMFLSDIRSAHVGPNGDVSPAEAVCSKPQDQSFAGLAFSGENFLAVWQDARTAPPEEYSPHREFDIHGARFTAGGAVIELGGFIISAEFPVCDRDNDGVPDGQDLCPDTLPGAIVNGDGCAVAQLSPCAGPWQNHAEYVDSVITHAWQFYREGIITAAQRGAIIHDAAQSDCGRVSPKQPAARVHLLPQTPEECKRDGLLVVISSDPIGSCTIETSTDLVNWTLFRTLDGADLGTEIGCSHSANEPSRFFRVRLPTP